MKDEQILKKVILKAVENGFESKEDNKLTVEMSGKSIIWKGLYSIIFSHDFAKAFWGEEKRAYCELCRVWSSDCYHYSDWVYIKHWKYNLQQMVLEPQPLKYLEKFL